MYVFQDSRVTRIRIVRVEGLDRTEGGRNLCLNNAGNRSEVTGD